MTYSVSCEFVAACLAYKCLYSLGDRSATQEDKLHHVGGIRVQSGPDSLLGMAPLRMVAEVLVERLTVV